MPRKKESELLYRKSEERKKAKKKYDSSVKGIKTMRHYHLTRNYGMTVEDYNKLVINQDGKNAPFVVQPSLEVLVKLED